MLTTEAESRIARPPADRSELPQYSLRQIRRRERAALCDGVPRPDCRLRAITVSLGRKNRHSTEKAKRVLGWQPRPAADTVLDCANSLLDWKVI